MLDEWVLGFLFQWIGCYFKVDDIVLFELEWVLRDGCKIFDKMRFFYELNEIILLCIVWGDFNLFDIDNWVYKFCIKDKVFGFNFYCQLLGLSSQVENWIGKLCFFYELEVVIQLDYIVCCMVYGEFGYVLDGKLVYLEFNFQWYVVDGLIKVCEGILLFFGIDGGGLLVVVIDQFLLNG